MFSIIAKTFPDFYVSLSHSLSLNLNEVEKKIVNKKNELVRRSQMEPSL